MLNTQQYLEMRNEAYKNDGAAIMSYDYDVNGIWDQTRNTNWQKELLGNTAHINNYQASISGGNTNTQYMINGGFRDQSLLFTNSKGMGDRSGSIRANISTTSLNNKLSITLDMGYVNDRNILPLTDLTNAALSLAPDAPALHNAEGSLNWANSTFQNPLAGMLQNNKAVTENLNGNLMIKYNVIQGLDIKTNIGYSKQEMNELAVLPGTSFDPAALTAGYAQRAANVGQSSVRSWIAEPQISYTKPLLGGTFSALAGTTFQQTVNKGYGFNAQGFPSDAQLLNFSIATSKTFFRQSYTDYRYTAAFARLNYNWQNKYIANITARRDGSSNFGPANQFGNFGAVGVAWVFTEEPWMKNLSWLSFGKLRSSYGITGNDKLTSYSYLSTYEYSYYTYGGVTALNPNRLANPSTQWEVNKKLELGIDAGFLNDRINITVNYFINRSGNQLVQYSLPDIAGYPFVNKNLPATIQNKGFEAVLNTTNIRSKSITWRSAFNISIPRNKLTSFPGIETTPYANQYTIGKSLNSLKQYHYLGVDPLTGIYTYQDVNKDGQLNYLDYVNTKEIGQRFFGGFNNSFSYKGLQLDVFFQYVKQTGRAFLYSFGAPGSANNKPVEVLDRWQHPGDAAAIGKFTTGSGSAAGIAFNNYMFGDNTIVDASFIRLKNVALNYTLPLKWRESLHLKNTQLYVTGDNLLTLTKFVGPDPETSGKVLPPMRTIVFGCRVSL
jgi:TonB-linked SusC/RagA family outer membrane protein